MSFRFGGKELTGIVDLRRRHSGVPAVVLGSGTTLKKFKQEWVPEEWPIMAINEAVAYGGRVDYWVLSDEPIVREYAGKCPSGATVLAMHQATVTIEDELRSGHNFVSHDIRTVNSMREVKNYNDGYRFFSRGTVMIGGVEMLRWMGVRKVFCFGLDCYRTRKAYYYDGREPPAPTEQKLVDSDVPRELPREARVWVTSRLKRMIAKLEEVKNSKLWEKLKIYCVNSPWSQQAAIPKIGLAEFEKLKTQALESTRRKVRRDKGEKLEKTPTEKSESRGDQARNGDSGGSPGSSLGDGEGTGIAVVGDS